MLDAIATEPALPSPRPSMRRLSSRLCESRSVAQA